MGFIRKQEELFAMRMLAWKCQKDGIPLPDRNTLRLQAKRIVDDAHRIARERGRNVVSIVKELAAGAFEKKE